MERKPKIPFVTAYFYKTLYGGRNSLNWPKLIQNLICIDQYESSISSQNMLTFLL